MKRLLTVALLALVAACGTPTEPFQGRGGDAGRPPFEDPERAYFCELAGKMMLRPGERDPQVPSEAMRRGRDLWNEWKCAEGGEIST